MLRALWLTGLTWLGLCALRSRLRTGLSLLIWLLGLRQLLWRGVRSGLALGQSLRWWWLARGSLSRLGGLRCTAPWRWAMLRLGSAALRFVHVRRLRRCPLRCMLARLSVICLLRLLSLMRLLLRLLNGEELLLLEGLRLAMGHLLLHVHSHVNGAHSGVCLHRSHLSGTNVLGTIG